MNRLFRRKISLVALITFGLTMNTSTQASDIERLVVSLCEYAKTNDRSGMRKKLKAAGTRLRNIYAGVRCGADGSLLRTATTAGAIDSATFIATKIGKKNLTAAEEDGKNILEFTQELVAAGDASKQEFVDLYQSKM